MQLRIFQSDEGDCLLLTSKDGRRVLCDGGRSKSMRDHVRAALAALHSAELMLDYVYVSHIDQDHIQGVEQLLKDLLGWRVFEAHAPGTVNQPDFDRPPEIGGILQNAFHDQVDANAGEIEELFAASVPVFYGSGVPELMTLGAATEEIATSVSQALRVSGFSGPDLLNIPINKLPGQTTPRKLLFFREQPQQFGLGSMTFTIVGPTRDELGQLKQGWNNFLEESPEKIEKIRAEIYKRVNEFANGALTTTPFDLGDFHGIPDFKGVTVPNIASLMFMVEEDNKTLLLTGDSQQDIIIKGLELAGFLAKDTNASLHLDVLKVQHHGSEHNVDEEFCRKISADNYVFCGDGAHHNPDLEVLQMILDSRQGGDADKLALAPKARDREFHFWFSTAPNQIDSSGRKEHYEAVQALVENAAAQAGSRLTTHFNDDDFIDLDI